MKSNLTKFLSLGLLVVFISSCANIEITKRRYRPGYHIDLVKKNERTKKNDTEVAVEQPKTEKNKNEIAEVAQAPKKTKAELRKERKAARKAAKEAIPEKKETPATFTADAGGDGEILKVKPFQDFAKQTRENALTFQKSKFSQKLRKAMKPDGEGSAWSVVSFIAMGLGVLAFSLVILAIAAAVAAGASGGPLTLFWTYGAIAAGVGLGAMITGIIGMKDTQDKRGRGFALAGMIAGIVGLVFGLIFLIWGLIFDFVLDDNF